jgi:hypothetical protein
MNDANVGLLKATLETKLARIANPGVAGVLVCFLVRAIRLSPCTNTSRL